MKPTVAVLLAAIAICCWTYALARSVEIGFVDKAGLRRWMAGGLAGVPTGETACTPAKFNQTSPCPTIVISNHSLHAVTLSFTTSSEEFAAGVQSGVVIGGSGPQPCARLNVHDRLEPGASCFESVDFWPRTGEVHYGTIQVIVKNPNGSTTTTFKVKGTSDYPPELQAAEEVRKRHEAELKRIPHVATVELDNRDGIKIDVTVNIFGLTPETFETYLEDVRRQVPPKIEGYDTEVTQYSEHVYED